MSPEALPPQPNFVTASADLFMNASDHINLRRDIVATAREAMLHRIANSFTADLKNITLRGRMPLGFSEDKYRSMHFKTKKDQNDDPEDASVEAWLMGSPDRNKQLRFVSEDRPVEFGRNKQFLITPFGESKPTDARSCAQFWYDLDLMIPDTGRFSALIDPRTDHAFDYIALRTADLLRPLSKSQETSRTYLSKDYTISQIGSVNYIGEIGSRLVVDQKGKKSTLRLSSTAPVDLENTRVIEHFEYRFEPNNKKPMSGRVSLSMLSDGLSKKELDQYLKKSQEDINASQIGQYALALLRNDLPTVR